MLREIYVIGFTALAEGFDVAVPRTSPTIRIVGGFEPRFAQSRVLGSWRLERTQSRSAACAGA